MRHAPALALSLALAGVAALGGPPRGADPLHLALFSFAVSAFRARLG